MSSASESSASEPSRSCLNASTSDDSNPLTFAQRLVREKQYGPAIRVCRTALQTGEPSAELHETLGRALLLSGDAEASLWHFLQTTLLAPQHTNGFVHLGAAYNHLQKFSQAVDVLAKAVKLSPTAAAYHNLGLAHRHLNNLPSAKTAFREALRLNPGLSHVHENLASVYVELHDFTRAITHYQKALEFRPNSATATAGLHKATLALAQPPDAPSASNSSLSAPLNSGVTSWIQPKHAAVNPTRARFLCRDIDRAANDMRQHFENTVIPLLSQMHRIVIDGRSNSVTFSNQLRDYRVACLHNSELRKTLRLLLVRLFATDELARTSAD